MGTELHKTAAYRILDGKDGRRYRFFCEASGMLLVTTEPVCRETPEEELEAAWKEQGIKHFNRCGKCGKWVCDAMYNADVLHCADCTPWENKPKFCPHCGIKVGISDNYCRKCGIKLQYREVVADDS